jgi:inorganic pyrophosphatase/exopolyphosphatase
MTDNYHTLYTEARQVTKLQLDKLQQYRSELPELTIGGIVDHHCFSSLFINTCKSHSG